MRNLNKIFIIFGLLIVSSCGLTDISGNLNDPNNVGPDALDLTTLNNKAQAEFGDFFRESSETGMELTRMLAMTGGDRYERVYQPQSHNDIWGAAYNNALQPIEVIIKDGTQKTAWRHVGTAKIMKAYIYMTLVDFFGDVPFSEANQADITGNFNPKVDKGQDIYNACIKLLDEAIVDLAKTTAVSLSRDVFYAGDVKRWTALANTLKLKGYMNLRLTDQAKAKTEITTLLAADLIDTEAEEFTYKYAPETVPNRARAELYRQFYQPALGGADGYLGNYFMFQAYKGKGIEDPRWRYYFYRQVGSKKEALNRDPNAIPCSVTPKPDHYIADGQPFCTFEPGFYGRDHGNNDGIPPDGPFLTAPGVYPFGGNVDNTAVDNTTFFGRTIQGQGANGAGIEPIWMSYFTDFLKAEAALTLGTGGDAKALTEAGVKASIARVQKFATQKSLAVTAPVTPTADYVAKVNELYAASTDKLDVSMKEYYLSLFGNGVEAYNLYRRTGSPKKIQPMRATLGGKFIRSLVYPADFVNLNPNAKQKVFDAYNKVFWDNNPDDFIN